MERRGLPVALRLEDVQQHATCRPCAICGHGGADESQRSCALMDGTPCETPSWHGNLIAVASAPNLPRPVPSYGSSLDRVKPLIIGEFHDPATTYTSAQKMRGFFPNGALMNWQGYRHGLPSTERERGPTRYARLPKERLRRLGLLQQDAGLPQVWHSSPEWVYLPDQWSGCRLSVLAHREGGAPMLMYGRPFSLSFALSALKTCRAVA